MKKYLPGFVPVNFKKSGFILLIIGLVCLILKMVSYLTDWFYIPGYLFYFGLALMLISFYLIFITPEE